jgi:NAD(P)H-flavin reductase
VSVALANAYLPWEAEVIEHIREAPDIVTLRLRLTDPKARAAYRFAPGQFNMVYLYGVGEVPISIVSDPEDEHALDHTIRAVGRVTRALVRLEQGARLGIRGPYGRGWPMSSAEGKDVVIVTGGLGCAPVMSVINFVLKRRERFGRLTIMQGVRHSNDLIWREHYERWSQLPDTQVLLAADVGGHNWPYSVGNVTVLLDRAKLDPANGIVMMCGPERMMQASARELLKRGFAREDLWLSLERNMQCGIGHCGHCQYGPKFVCHDGPVFHYPEIEALFGRTGF